MTVDALLDALTVAGVRLDLAEAGVRATPASALTPELRAGIKANLPQLRELLADAELCGAIEADQELPRGSLTLRTVAELDAMRPEGWESRCPSNPATACC